MNADMHGLRMPNEAFFHQNPKLLDLGRQFGQINFGAFGVFLADLSAPILVWYLGLGFEFEFGPQRIMDLAIVCP